MKKLSLALLAVGIVITAACSSTPTATTTADTAATATTQAGVTTTTIDKRPGSPQVYADIAADSDCTTLQESFDRAEATSKRPGGPAGATWSQIGVAYMKAADDRMSTVGCY
jgi:hypothetical protein